MLRNLVVNKFCEIPYSRHENKKSVKVCFNSSIGLEANSELCKRTELKYTGL